MARKPGLTGLKAGRPSSEKQKALEAVTKPEKAKVVRDSFTMPPDEYEQIGAIRQACMKHGIAPSKAEILRAGIHILSQKSPEEIAAIIRNLPEVRPTRGILKPST